MSIYTLLKIVTSPKTVIMPVGPDQEQPAVDPNIAAAAAADNNNRPGRNNNGQQQIPVMNVRERLFHALFFRVAMSYARAIPRPIRRFLEFAILLKVFHLASQS